MFKINRVITGLWLILFAASVTCFGNEQIVKSHRDPKVIKVPATESFSFDVVYATDPASQSLTGLGMQVTYDASKLTFTDITNAYDNTVTIGSSSFDVFLGYSGPAANPSAGASFESVNIAWADPSATPTFDPSAGSLFTANFTAKAGFTGTTAVSFEPVSTPAAEITVDGGGSVTVVEPAYTLTATSVTIEEGSPYTVTPVALDFGDVLDGESSALHVLVENTSGDEADITLTADNGDFALEASSLTVPADDFAFDTITYTPGGTGADAGTLTLSEGGSAFQAVSLDGAGVDGAVSNHLRLSENIAVTPSGARGVQQVTFDILFTSHEGLRTLQFDLEYPAGLMAIDSLAVADTTRTPPASSFFTGDAIDNGTGSAVVSFNDFTAQNGAVLAGTGPIVTVTASITDDNIDIGAIKITNVSTLPAVTVTTGFGEIVVGNPQSCSLNVDGSASDDFDDIILIFRRAILGLGASSLVPSALSPSLSAAEIIDNIDCLTPKLDIDGCGGGAPVDFDDIILLFRGSILGLGSGSIVPAALSPCVAADSIVSSIQRVRTATAGRSVADDGGGARSARAEDNTLAISSGQGLQGSTGNTLTISAATSPLLRNFNTKLLFDTSVITVTGVTKAGRVADQATTAFFQNQSGGRWLRNRRA